MSKSATVWQVDVGADRTRAIFEPAEKNGNDTAFVCAHGAGGHMRDRSLESLVPELLQRGISVVRFNFLYREEGSRCPDRMPRLQACLGAVVDHTRRELAPRTLIIGGRSMGGRAASMLAAEGMACDGLLLLAYPLHPSGKAEKLRDTHLSQIRAPVLCLNGTRDALCQRDLMEQVVQRLKPTWQMHWLEGADHSFHVKKSSGRTDAAVLTEAADATARWVSTLTSGCRDHARLLPPRSR